MSEDQLNQSPNQGDEPVTGPILTSEEVSAFFEKGLTSAELGSFFRSNILDKLGADIPYPTHVLNETNETKVLDAASAAHLLEVSSEATFNVGPADENEYNLEKVDGLWVLEGTTPAVDEPAEDVVDEENPPAVPE